MNGTDGATARSLWFRLALIQVRAPAWLSPHAKIRSGSVRSSEAMKSFGGALMGGYLAVPVAEGKFPARIDFMGYGAEPYLYGADDNPNLIQFLVSVRGQGIFKEPEGRWIDRGLDGKENFYYRGAYCDAVRAVDFIKDCDIRISIKR